MPRCPVVYVTQTGTALHCASLHAILLTLQDHICQLHAHALCFTTALKPFFSFFQDTEKIIIEHLTQSASTLPQATASLLAQQPGLLPGSVSGQAAVQVGSFSTDTQDQLRKLVAEELSQATQSVVAQALCPKPCDCICSAVLQLTSSDGAVLGHVLQDACAILQYKLAFDQVLHVGIRRSLKFDDRACVCTFSTAL